jgi:hypothetical protein
MKRCPIHGTPIDGGPILFRCPLDGGHPVQLPEYADAINWPAVCDGCGTKKSVALISASGWLCSDEYLDFHLCPRCVKRVGRRLLREFEQPVFVRFFNMVRRTRRPGGSDVWRAWGRYILRRNTKPL